MNSFLKRILAGGLLLIAGGCWDNKDINHRSLPIAMGISYDQGKYKIYLDIPQISEQNKEQIQIISDEGDSINEVIDRISMNMETQVDLLHLKVIVVDKAFAMHGMKDGIASIIRSRHIAPKTVFVVCNELLEGFFNRLETSSKNRSTAIYDYFQKNAGWSPDIAYAQTWKIFRSIHSLTHDVVLPVIVSGDSTIFQSKGSVILKNGKMAGRLTNEETLLYNLFNGVNTQGKIEVMGRATVQIVSSRIRIRHSFVHNQPRMTSTVNMKVILLDTRNDPSAELIKSDLRKLLTERFTQLFMKTQQVDADIFGLGQHFRADLSRKQLEAWRTEYLPRLKMDVRVKITIRNTGNLKTRS